MKIHRFPLRRGAPADPPIASGAIPVGGTHPNRPRSAGGEHDRDARAARQARLLRDRGMTEACVRACVRKPEARSARDATARV